MRTPEQVLNQIRTRYESTWRDWLVAPPPDQIEFPLNAPTADQIARRAAEVEGWLQAWDAWQQQHPALLLRPAVRRTVLGEQRIVTHLQADSVSALVSADPDLAQHWHTAQRRWLQLVDVPSPASLRPHLSQIMDLDQNDFTVLLAAVRWLADYPRSGLTPRQVPVAGMHTKWLARHRRFVLAALGHTTSSRAARDDAALTPDAATEPTQDDEVPADDLDLLGLRPLPHEADIILADPADRAAMAGLQHIRAPIGELAHLPLQPHIVLVVENKESAYLVPDHPTLVVIHSLGNHLDALSQLPWLLKAQVLLYWGDLDRAGLTLLSRARAQHPQLRSVLMSVDDVRAHLHLAVPERASRVDPPLPTLQTHERAALTAICGAINGRHAQLEQERLPADVVLASLKQILSSV